MNAFYRFSFRLIFAFLIWSCGSSDTKKEDVSAEKGLDNESEFYYQNLIGIGLSKQNSWFQHWSSALGAFGSTDFNLVSTDSINPMEMPETNPLSSSDPLFPYQFPHPEGNGTIDIYFYKVEAQESLDQPFLNPDSEVIWFKADGMKERLLFMGPSGMFEEGIWVNAQEFLVFGYFQEEAGFVPMVWILDVNNHLLRQFKLNKITETYLPASYLDKKLKSVNLTKNGI
jgi:hypothetical protein